MRHYLLEQNLKRVRRMANPLVDCLRHKIHMLDSKAAQQCQGLDYIDNVKGWTELTMSTAGQN